MTTQYAVFSGLPTGLTLTKKVFTVADPDVEVTGITGAITERTNAKGQYTVAVTKSAVITGIHTIILFVGSTPIAIGKRTFAGTDAETAVETPVIAELDSASRLAIWNTLTTETFTADSFGELLIISDGTNGREVKVTGANHIAADVHDCQADGLSASTEIINIQNASGYLLAVLAGACADPQTASETYAITVFGSTFTVDMAGQTSTGTRTAPTLTKT